MRFVTRIIGLACLSLSLASIAEGQSVQYRSGTGVEYRSLPDTGPIARAERALGADPRNVQLIIQLGIAQSGARQFREAIETFTRGLAIAPNEPMLYRWRGHRYLSVREFSLARSDFARGLRLDSANYGILYHRGVVQFASGEFEDASGSFARALPRAPDAGERAGATDWLWMSLSRAGKAAEAKQLLDRRPDSLPVSNAYARRLRLYRGEIRPDEVLTASDTGDVNVATLSYGLGNWYLLRGDTAKAREYFERSIASGGWPAFGFIVAEMELRRLRYADTRFNYDSLSMLLKEVQPIVAPLIRRRDSAIATVRADSGTLRADSSYWRYRAELNGDVRLATKMFDSTALPSVFSSMRFLTLQRRLGLPPSHRADPFYVAIADSIRRFLSSYGIWAYIAEGDGYFVPDEGVLARAFEPFLTKAGRHFSHIRLTEQQAPVAEDASLQISPDGLERRLVGTDSFLASYPGALGADEIRKWHKTYLLYFLGLAPNTTAYDWRTKGLHPDWRRRFERYVATHPSTSSGQTVAKYLALLRANNYVRTDAVEAFVRELFAWH